MAAVLNLLARYDLDGADDPVLLQSFDQGALIRARHELHSQLRMVQLIGENSWHESPDDFDYLRSPEGLAGIAKYAQGIGPWIPHVVAFKSNNSSDISELTARAHALGLFVHAYTLRADDLPPRAGTLANAVRVLAGEAGLDGVFTDQPDQVLQHLPARNLP
jgi:glycerophosphoryl diester phosphodiesterase